MEASAMSLTSRLSAAIVLLTAFPGSLTAQTSPPAHPVTLAQVREFLELTKEDEGYRARWLAALDKNRSKVPPYWPESFWSDARNEMQTTDLAPMIASVYQHYISAEMMDSVNAAIRREGVVLFAFTPLGVKFSKLQQSTEEEEKAARFDLTLQILQRVDQRHKDEINALRAKYISEHPGYPN
jgi:hypothetical protein